jgi:DNA replicative helicase MCM subunit Mcm2 (Cdc46/Mcm family)
MKYHKTSIVLTNIPFTKKIYPKINAFSSSDIGKWVVVTGTVVLALQTKALEKSKIFACNQCGAQYRL